MLLSTTKVAPLSATFSAIFLKSSSSIPAITFPDKKTTSSVVKTSSFAKNSEIFSAFTALLCPLISVSVSVVSFILIRVVPRVSTKSCSMPNLSNSDLMKYPVKPATKPSALVFLPILFNNIEMFIPFPPTTYFASCVLFNFPRLKLLAFVSISTAGFKVIV